jgi:hypothetical protein
MNLQDGRVVRTFRSSPLVTDRHVTVIERNCARCGEPFEVRSVDWGAVARKRYCTGACRQAAYRERKRQ